VDLTLFAVKNDQNDYLRNGLTGQPFSGPFAVVGPFNDVGGFRVGGLDSLITQTAGVRTVIGTPWKGTLGLTFYQAWDATAYAAATPDQARVYGIDVSANLPWVETLAVAASWTKSDTLNGTSTIDYGSTNQAWDAKFSGNVAALNIAAGYKDIGRNFAAAGSWDKIGRWTNPVNVKGPYAEFAYPIMDNLKISLNGEFLKTKDPLGPTFAWGQYKDDKLVAGELAVKWGFTKTCSLDLAYQAVKFESQIAGSADAAESYITVGLAHQVSPNAGVKVGYQMISYDNGSVGPYGADYRGGQGVVQVGVSF